MKNHLKRILIGVWAISIIVIVVGFYTYNGGTLGPNKPIDLSCLGDSNRVRVKQNVERSNTVTGVVIGFNDYMDDTIYLELEGYPDVSCWAYLTLSDVAKLDIGDTVTIRGRVWYRGHKEFSIVIGDAISVWPLSFSARVTNIEKGN